MRFEAYNDVGTTRWASDFVRLEANVEAGGGVVETPSDFVRRGGAVDGVDPSPGFVRLEPADVEGTSTTPVLVCLQAPEVDGVTASPDDDFVRLEAAEVEVADTSPDDFVRLVSAAVVEGVDTSPDGFVTLESAAVAEGVDASSGFVSLKLADVEGVNTSPPPRRPLWLLESDALPSVAVKYPELPFVAEFARDRRIDPSCQTSSSSSFALAIYPHQKRGGE